MRKNQDERLLDAEGMDLCPPDFGGWKFVFLLAPGIIVIGGLVLILWCILS